MQNNVSTSTLATTTKGSFSSTSSSSSPLLPQKQLQNSGHVEVAGSGNPSCPDRSMARCSGADAPIVRGPRDSNLGTIGFECYSNPVVVVAVHRKMVWWFIYFSIFLVMLFGIFSFFVLFLCIICFCKILKICWRHCLIHSPWILLESLLDVELWVNVKWFWPLYKC